MLHIYYTCSSSDIPTFHIYYHTPQTPTHRFTGSLLFSQTLHTYRSHVHSRIPAIVILSTLFILAFRPFSFATIIPRFLPASLVLLHGFDITFEWLVQSKPKISPLEYTLMWITLVSMIILGLF